MKDALLAVFGSFCMMGPAAYVGQVSTVMATTLQETTCPLMVSF